MNVNGKHIFLAMLLAAGSAGAWACEYVAGETRFVDYAHCRYGSDQVVVAELPVGAGWERCVYHVEPFRPPKLLAVTRMEGDREVLSINDRSQIGNPCYLTKSHCDAALKAER